MGNRPHASWARLERKFLLFEQLPAIFVTDSIYASGAVLSYLQKMRQIGCVSIQEEVPLSKRYHSGLKANRQSIVRRMRNKSEMSKIRTQVKKSRVALAEGKKDEAVALMPELFSVLDKGVKHGRLHKNTVARKKARMAKKLASLAKA